MQAAPSLRSCRSCASAGAAIRTRPAAGLRAPASWAEWPPGSTAPLYAACRRRANRAAQRAERASQRRPASAGPACAQALGRRARPCMGVVDGRAVAREARVTRPGDEVRVGAARPAPVRIRQKGLRHTSRGRRFLNGSRCRRAGKGFTWRRIRRAAKARHRVDRAGNGIMLGLCSPAPPASRCAGTRSCARVCPRLVCACLRLFARLPVPQPPVPAQCVFRS